jgi:acyl-CoA dehydrogenase
LVDNDLPERYEGILAAARALATEVEPYAAEADESESVDPRVHAALRESGLCELMGPRAWGGRTDALDPLAICLVREVLMASSGHLDALFSLQGIGSYAIARAGTQAQRERWLPQVAQGTALAALALTEPDAGSDLKAIQTTLTPAATGLILNGTKSFISNAGAAAFYTVLALEGDGYSLVVVPADADGLATGPSTPLIAPHVIGELRFTDVPIDDEARLGAAGTGFGHVLATLTVFRASVAGAAVGLAQAALDIAVAHTTTRTQFGRPLIGQGQVGALLADSWIEIEMARLLTYRAASAAVAGGAESLNLSSMAKLAATETAGRVVDRAVQVMGRFGLVKGSKIERLYRQARAMRIYEGASETLRAGIAKRLADG